MLSLQSFSTGSSVAYTPASVNKAVLLAFVSVSASFRGYFAFVVAVDDGAIVLVSSHP